MKKTRGFTLIELMISMAILSFIALFVYQNTSRSFVLRENLSLDGDFYSSLRVAMDVVRRDLAHIYTPQAAALPGDLGKSQLSNSGNDVGSNPSAAPAYTSPTGPLPTDVHRFWGALVNNKGVRPSRIQGEESKISFVTNSHIRLYKDTVESDFALISYSVETDPLSTDGDKILVKTENPLAFDMDEADKSKEVHYTLLNHVKKMKLRYLDGEKDTWFNTWDNSSMEHRNKFPSLIEVEIELDLPRSLSSFTVLQRFRPELPL